MSVNVKILRDYKEFREGDEVEVDERTAKNLFKLRAASVHKKITKANTKRK